VKSALLVALSTSFLTGPAFAANSVKCDALFDPIRSSIFSMISARNEKLDGNFQLVQSQIRARLEKHLHDYGEENELNVKNFDQVLRHAMDGYKVKLEILAEREPDLFEYVLENMRTFDQPKLALITSAVFEIERTSDYQVRLLVGSLNKFFQTIVLIRSMP
jgi:hypothetical protein